MDNVSISPERARELLDGDLVGVTLAYSRSGYGTIYIAPVENEDTAVAVPVRDKNAGWHKANPEAYMALVDRFNAAPDLARAYLAEHEARVAAEAEAATLRARLAEAEGKVAALTEAVMPFAAVVKQMSLSHLSIQDDDLLKISGKHLLRAYDTLAAVKEAEHG